MMRLLTLVALFTLGACGDKPQNLQTYKGDGPAFQGPAGPFAATGWKVGDKTSWEQGLKTRLQNTQNEYNKLPSAK